MWYAFARDDGMPGSSFIKQVNPRYRTPVNSIIITSILAVALCLWSAGYWVVTSISTITLYLAYMFPVYLNWRNKRRGRGEFTTRETAPWTLGRWGLLVNAIAIGWCVTLAVIFSLPPNELVLWTMIGLSVLMFAYWQLYAKARFQGPSKSDESALRSMEQQVGQAQAVGVA
jgi:amino acid transporter